MEWKVTKAAKIDLSHAINNKVQEWRRTDASAGCVSHSAVVVRRQANTATASAKTQPPEHRRELAPRSIRHPCIRCIKNYPARLVITQNASYKMDERKRKSHKKPWPDCRNRYYLPKTVHVSSIWSSKLDSSISFGG